MYEIKIKNCDLDQIAESGQCFRWRRMGERAYKIPAFGRAVEVSQKGDRFLFSCDETEFFEIWREYFDLDTDYESLIGEVASGDLFLKEAAAYGSGIRILRQDLWEVMLSFLISQNNNIPRIKKSVETLCSKYNPVSESPDSIDNGAVPSAEQILHGGEEYLKSREMGLGYRDTYIWELCRYMEQNPAFMQELQRADYTEAMRLLMERKGVGKKVAGCICLFGLHKLHACPVDTWVKKIIEEDYNGRMPDWMKGSYAGVYQQYAFYYKRSRNGAPSF